MYKLFGRVSKGHDEMKTSISNYIRELGKGINEKVTSSSSNVTNEEANNAVGGSEKQTGTNVAIRWVQEVLDLKDKFDKLLRVSCAIDIALLFILKYALYTNSFLSFDNNFSYDIFHKKNL